MSKIKKSSKEVQPQGTLIIKPSSLGDVIHTLPLVHALKRCRSDQRIGWIVQQSYASLLECDSAIDVVYPIKIPSTSEPGAGKDRYFKALKATVQTMFYLKGMFRECPYEKVLDLHASFRSGLLGMTNPGGLKIGFSDGKEGNTWFQHERVQVPPGEIHALDKNLLFAKHLQCAVTSSDFYMECTAADEQKVDHFLKQHGIVERPLIYLAPSARWESKFWQVEKWRQLASRLYDLGLQPILGGGPADLAYADLLCKGQGDALINTAGEFSLTQTVALMQRSTLYVGLDTGPMHMAAMIGLPVVALFGPTHPERVGPYGVAHRIVRNENADCLCCRKRSCSDMQCMHGISVNQVLFAIKDLLPEL